MLLSIQCSLDKLSQEVKEYSQKVNAPALTESQKPQVQIKVESMKPEPTPRENAEPAFGRHQENFISEEEFQVLKYFLDTESFILR